MQKTSHYKITDQSRKKKNKTKLLIRLNCDNILKIKLKKKL